MYKSSLVITLLFVFSFLLTGCLSEEKSATDNLIEFVDTEMQDEDKYWFKMKNRLDGSWNPVILIFGYADNKSACNFLLEYAEQTSPDVMFSCDEI